jgi:hypothetical protein
MLRRATLLLLVILGGACERVEPPPPAPLAEFIVSAGDSAFWIRSDADGIRVRGAPLVLAFVGGRFAELYVADDDQSFYDAVYVGQRLFKRDIISGDSMLIVTDTLMRLLARGYATANPDERPLAFDEEGSENPRTIASAEIRVLDVMGPWVSYEYRTDVDVIGGASSHGLRRGVVDLRTGAMTTLEALFGRQQGRIAVVEGQRQWREMRDSMLVAAPDDAVLRESLERLAFDARSFVLLAEGREPRVRFTLAQSGSRFMAPAQELFPIGVQGPAWWEGVREGYPLTGDGLDLTEQRWPRPEYDVIARPVSGSTRPRIAFALRDAGGQEWPLGFVPSPVQRIMWLDDSTLAAGTRAALVRAFDDAALYSEDTRVVRDVRPVRRAAPLFQFATFAPRPTTVPRRSPPARSRH